MLLPTILHQLEEIVRSVVNQVEAWVKTCTKPTFESLIGGMAAELLKSKSDLIAENAFLRQQLIVMKRKVTHPKLTSTDRGLLVMLASRVRGWKRALLIVKPDTLLKWHQQGFKLFWRLKSKGEARKPRISEETIALIKQMAIETRRWGAKRIRGELLKLGIQVNKGTIRRYMKQARRKLPAQSRGQTWATFLANHGREIWACDFVQTYDLFFRTIFVFFIIEHSSRRVVHFGITRSPSDEWVAQQIREATPFGEGPRYLVCDNDAKYGPRFEQAVTGAAIELIHTPYYTPKANAICERFIGSVRRECLDFMLILSQAHGRKVIREYVTFFNQARPHQGIDQQIPVPTDDPPLTNHTGCKVVGLPVLGGLHHHYRWAA